MNGRARNAGRSLSLPAAAAELQRATTDVIQAVAADALAAGVGGRLPISSDYQSRLGVGAGTVQKAIELLVDAGAMQLRSRGHLGRFISDLRLDRLWRLAEIDPVRAILPPRGPIEVRALAGALFKGFERLGIPYRLRHAPGAASRVDSVFAGEADIALVSTGFASDAIAEKARCAVFFRRLAQHTYYAEGTMLVLQSAASLELAPSEFRIAIDRTSFDQARLTEREFPRDEVRCYVDIEFPRVPVAILEGRVDAGIWHNMQTLIPPRLAGLQVRQLERPASLALLKEGSAAQLVVSRKRPELRAVIEALDLDDVAAADERLLALPPDSADLLDLYWSV